MSRISSVAALAAAALVVVSAGCDTAYSPGRPRYPSWTRGVRPQTSPQAVLANATLAYNTRDVSLFLAQLDPDLFAFTEAQQPPCDYECATLRVRDDLLGANVRSVSFSTSPDTLAIETFAPLDPPGAVAFDFRWTILDRGFSSGRSVHLVRGAMITVAPTGPGSAPWRVVRWMWTRPDTSSWPVQQPPGSETSVFPWNPALLESPAGAVRLLEEAFSHARVSNAVQVFMATVDSTRFEHLWEKLGSDSTQIGGRGADLEARFLKSISIGSFTKLKLTLFSGPDSLTPQPSPSTDPRDPPGSLVFDLPNTGQHYEDTSRSFDVKFRHSLITVAPGAPGANGATRWHAVRWFDRGALDGTTLATR